MTAGSLTKEDAVTPLNPVFRLRPYTIRKFKDKFYVSTDDHPKDWGKSYNSLRQAAIAIARKLEREWSERASRYEVRT